MKALTSAKTLWIVAIARIHQLIDIWSTATADVIVVVQMSWCALVIHSNPGYLSSTMRLKELQEQFPPEAWQIAFAAGAAFQAVCLLFGSEPDPMGVKNPLMATERQVMLWKLVRMAGWLFAIFFNLLIVLLISKQGWLNFGTGFFGLAAGCSIIAFSFPFRMFCADIRKNIDKRHQQIRLEQLRQFRRSQARGYTFPSDPSGSASK